MGSVYPRPWRPARWLPGSLRSLVCLGECYTLGQKAGEGLVGKDAQCQVGVKLSRALKVRLRIQAVSWRGQSPPRGI